MTETNTSKADPQELESTPQYGVGDIIESVHGATFVLIEPVRKSNEGPIANRIEIDEQGNGQGSVGTIHIEDIAKIIGHLSKDELDTFYVEALGRQYPTLSRATVLEIAAAAFGKST